MLAKSLIELNPNWQVPDLKKYKLSPRVSQVTVFSILVEFRVSEDFAGTESEVRN